MGFVWTPSFLFKNDDLGNQTSLRVNKSFDELLTNCLDPAQRNHYVLKAERSLLILFTQLFVRLRFDSNLVVDLFLFVKSSFTWSFHDIYLHILNMFDYIFLLSLLSWFGYFLAIRLFVHDPPPKTNRPLRRAWKMTVPETFPLVGATFVDT